MNVAALIDLLIEHEGERLKPYTDTSGKLSIGIGRNLSDVGISQDESRVLLSHDIEHVLTDLALFPWFAALDDGRQRAVADLRFNVGGAAFRQFVHFIAAMARGNWSVASEELAKSHWAHQVQPRRVSDVRRLIEQGED